MKFYYTLIIIAPRAVSKMAEQRRIASCVRGLYIPLIVPYLQEIRTATAGEIYSQDWQCFGPLCSMSQ